jgi:membrane-bound lytic murein transglycosylase D
MLPFAPHILDALLHPLARAGHDPDALIRGQQLGIGFSILFKIMLWGGLMLSLPLLLFFLAQFIFPGLTRRERGLIRNALFASGVLFLAGVLLAYRTTLALAIEALFRVNDWMGIEIWPLQLEAYIGMIVKTLLAFGVAFQLPIALLALGWLGIVSAQALRARRRHAIVAIFVIAMILTPPDPISQIVMALPMCLMYEICILLIALHRKTANHEVSHSRARLGAILLLLCGGCASTSGTKPYTLMSWDELGAWAGFGTDDGASLERASVQSWFGDVSEGLNAQSIAQIAAYAGEARMIAAWAANYEALAPYAAWLKARLDYYEAAQAAVESVAAAGRPRESPVKAPSKPILLPKPPPRGTITVRGAAPVLPPPRPRHQPPSATVPSATVERERARAATQSSFWKKKVASHSLPERAQALVPQLAPIFRAEQVPECLVWIAEVESSFNPAARSPAGAAGLYQLMPATARSLGLSTANPDQRLVPADNARAAAKYYRQLYKRFGSWPLVFAAYNCGEGRVSGAVKRAGTRSYAAIASGLPLETRMYVPRVQETIRLRAGIAPEAMP